VNLACVVEGHGEVEAVPILIEKIVQARDPRAHVTLLRPVHRVPRGKMVANEGAELVRAVRFQASRVGPDGAILVLLDADGDCPAELGPSVGRIAASAAPGVRVGVVVAKQEYEAWLVASAQSLSGYAGLATALAAPPDPEGLPNPKGWLSQRMERRYAETTDQAKLTHRLDLAFVEDLPSFQKLLRELGRLTGMESTSR
jgi:hypothetical protein